MNKRKALGKGLSSLIPDAPISGAAGVLQIDVGLVHPNPDQPRKSFDAEALEELAGSIRAHGLLQPVVVAREGEGFRLIIGERRWRAAMQAGLKKIPALIRDADEGRRLELALIENLQRQELNPLEEAQAYRLLVDEFDLSHEELAARLGKSRPYISNILRLLDLDATIREHLKAGRLTMGHARALAGVADAARQRALAEKVIARSLSVRDTEALVAAGRGQAHEPGDGAGTRARRQDPNVRAAEERLKRALGTEVRISGSPRKGRIAVTYTSAAELQRLFEALERAGRTAPPPAAAASRVSLPGGPPLGREKAGS